MTEPGKHTKIIAHRYMSRQACKDRDHAQLLISFISTSMPSFTIYFELRAFKCKGLDMEDTR